MPRLNEARALARIISAEVAMVDYKKKVYRLRRIIAGDKDALTSEAVGTNRDIGFKSARAFRENTPDILVKQFDEGRNNDLLNLTGVLVEQSVYNFPNIEVRGLTNHMQVLHSGYLKRRLADCNAIHHAKIAMWDMIMGGMGDVYITSEMGKPALRWADSLDIKFDQTARLICDVRWKSIVVCETFDYWVQIFGEKPFDSYLATRKDSASSRMDAPFEMEFYYDMETDGGNLMVFSKISDSGYDEKPVYKGENPNFWTIQGEKSPYLPFESLFYNALPSVRFPMGAGEKALPAQIAVWRAATRIQGIIDSGPAFYEIVKGMDEEQKQAFLEARLNGIVEVDEAHFGMMKEHPPLPITPTDMEELGRNQEALKRQLGTSNYSLGATEDVKFATESNAIQASGSLTAGSIAKDNADWWSRFVPKFVAKAKIVEKRPITLRIDGVNEDFSPANNPINDYLTPDAEYVVAEDSMRFIPQDVKVANAYAILQTAISLQMQFPGAVAPAYRKYLEVSGVEDVEERMKQPMPSPMMPTGAPGAPASAGQTAQGPMSTQLSSEAGTAA